MRFAGAADAAGEIIFIINYKYYGVVNERAGALVRYPPTLAGIFSCLGDRRVEVFIYTPYFSAKGVKERDGYDGGGEADQEDCAENGG